MAEEIVACPGCAKKFRIPEGAESGSFACTACGVDVPYGAAARKPAPAAKAAARPSPVGPPAARPAATATSSRRSARRAEAHAGHGHGHGRHSGRDDAPKNSHMGLIWGGIAVGGVALIALVYYSTKPATTAPSSTSSSASSTPAIPTPPKPADPTKATPPKPEDPPKTDTAAPVKPADPVAGNPAPKPAAADPKKPDTPPAKPLFKHDNSVLGQTFESVAGVTPEERAELDKAVALAMDRNSGKDGANAETMLVRKGKKSIPSILSAFGKQYSGGKWATDEDQWSADKLQDLLHRITGADCIYPDYWPKFMSGASPEDFEKAANMWVAWWQTAQTKEKFKRGDEGKDGK